MEFRKDYSQIKDYDEKYNYQEITNIISRFDDLNKTFQTTKDNFDEENSILKNIIIQNIATQKKDPLIYLLLGAIIFLIGILIAVFIYFIRASKKNVNTNQEHNINKTQKEKVTETPDVHEKKVKKDDNIVQNSKIEVDDTNSSTNNEDIQSKKIESSNQNIIIQKSSTIKLEKDEEIIKDYLEIYSNPRNIMQFKLKWKVQPLERVSPLTKQEEVVLETSKKILERSNFWSIQDPEDSSILYILPGKILWSRIQEIMTDNSRFGFMNFNGIYSIKETKKNEIISLATASKDESGKINIIMNGEIQILKTI